MCKKSADEVAKELFENGYSCSQAVVGAFAEELEMDFETLMKISSSFGGGMGRLREVCGSVSGMFMVMGLKHGYSDPEDYELKKEHYERIQELAKEFRDENGSYVCRELLSLGKGNSDPSPEVRNEKYYKKRPCSELVAYAAKMTDDYLREKEVK